MTIGHEMSQERRAFSSITSSDMTTNKIPSPVSTLYAWNAWDYDPPFGDQIELQQMAYIL